MVRLTPTTIDTRREKPRVKQYRHIPLMARLYALCGMNNQVKHTCTIGYSIPPITFWLIDSATLAMRHVSPECSFRAKGGDVNTVAK